MYLNTQQTMGFVRAMQYFDNIIISVATLLEPIAATLIAFALGVGGLPGTMGWIGNGLVAVGTLAVVYPSIDKPVNH
jgi:NADH:ubiquinone oxidoreductase subunit 4 (subunit M)